MAVKRAPTWVIVVRRDRPEVYTRLQRSFAGSPLVEVILERRERERRRGANPADTDRRRADRRQPADGRSPSSAGGRRFLQRTAAYDVLEIDARLLMRCPRCDASLEVEMPRFGELPARLDLDVLHAPSEAHGVKHFVEAQAFRETGRSILACRLLARRQDAGNGHVASGAATADDANDTNERLARRVIRK